MTQFDDRLKGQEGKFALDEDKKFKATVRRDRLFGRWAAEVLGKAGPAAEAYAEEVVAANFIEAADGDIIRKVGNDLKMAGHPMSELELENVLAEMLVKAAAQPG